MTGRIEHWDRRYRTRDAAAVGRLNALAGAVLAAYEQAVGTADPDAVVLVRAVRAVLVVSADDRDDADLARRWGRAMAAAVLKAVAAGEPDTVARFASPAAHLAAFVAAAAAGRPTDHWTFARFAPACRDSAADTVAAALLAHPALAPAALAELHRLGAAADAVRVLGPQAGPVWAEAVGGPPPQSAAAERPVFAAALGVVTRLGGTLADADTGAWFAEFVAGPRPPTDWADRTHLAEAVAAAVRFVVGKTFLAKRPTAQVIAAAVAPLDWLDTNWLARRLETLFAESTPAPASAKVRRESPRLREWTAAIHTAVGQLAVRLASHQSVPPADALRVFAAVAAWHPDWAADPALPAFVEHALATLAAELATGRPETSLGIPAEPIRTGATVPAAPAVAPVFREAIDSIGTPTDAAGAFLLLRAVYDLRLLAAARRAGFPGDGAERWAVAAVAAAWAGLPLGDRPDTGLLLLAGLEPDAAPPDFSDAGRRARAFSVGVLRAAAGHRLIANPERLTIAVVPDAGGWLAFGGDADAGVWPLAVPVDSPDAVPIEDWQADWAETFGSTPEIARVESDPLRAAVAHLGPGTVTDRRSSAAIAAAALVALHAWARWLRPFAGASAGYLLDQFVRRPGRVALADGRLTVELARRPLDVALQVCGGLDPFDLPPGSRPRSVRFVLKGAG